MINILQDNQMFANVENYDKNYHDMTFLKIWGGRCLEIMIGFWTFYTI